MVVWEALDALSHQLELCAIDAESRVVIVLDDRVTNDRAALIRAAVARSGADAIEVRSVYATSTEPSTALAGTSHELGYRSSEESLLAAAVASADLVITSRADLAESLSDHDRPTLHLGRAAPHAFPPHANLRRRVSGLERALASASALVVTDQHGTNLQFELADSSLSFDHGFVGEDRPTASFPAGWVAAMPAAGTVSGELVIMPGDANVNAQRMMSSPLRLHVFDDHVSAIDGDSPDADVIRALFEYARQPSAYGVAGLSMGLNPGREPAAPFDERLLDAHLCRLLAGVVTLSFGDNLVADRPCTQTVTLAFAGRTVMLDGLPVIVDGHLQGDFAPDVYET